MTILVTGATGNVGRNVVEQLLAEGASVRATSRDPEEAGLPPGVDVHAADLARPETFADALSGVDSVYLFPSPDTAGEFAKLAEAAGVRRVVVLSSLSAKETGAENDEIGRRHVLVERAIEASTMDWTFVRPGSFAANTLQWAHSIRAESVVRAPYGDAQVAPVHEKDIAAVAVRALLDEGHAGKAYELTGPESITQRQQVELIGKAIGRPVRFEEQTPEQARELMSKWALVGVIDSLLGYLGEAVGRSAEIFDVTEKITGRPASTFADWAAAHARDFA
ncbi:NAD(P)H-binding protein [Allokutzneria sp. A3M-2-11 16]|uniref:NAD(P)H-binding protein n=1 Tax=Allokutzneria sp. A3M-2-11 16 TaxID=2962043 RepID=UPI0020B7C548|nr:NAD(P)H-binding protein [Allokutzneria sp. A3M-2-11 16]MCP3800294.1 NAD(P)H-binding protein [Allokutzneria sp. A3M-2-11 16]